MSNERSEGELGRKVRYASLGYQIEAPPTTRSRPATTNPNQSIELHSGTRSCRKTCSTDDDGYQLRLMKVICKFTNVIVALLGL